jgi:peptide/nickel transport system ATP-binding protein
MSQELLKINHATKAYGSGLFSSRGQVVVLNDFNGSFPAGPARITTVAGESGSGKTTLAHAVLGFIRLTSGSITFRGTDIASLRGGAYREYRRSVQAVFQDPYEVYNPFYKVKHMLDMAVRNFRLAPAPGAAGEIIEKALEAVGLRGGEVLDHFPHQLSGGQRQRLMMARAFLLKPSIIIADEPVSMIDASLRSMVLDTMMTLRDQHRISFLYITHDLSTAYQVGDDLIVLYRGSIMEQGRTTDVIDNPKHPYVKDLIEAIPVPDPSVAWNPGRPIPEDTGTAGKPETGCPYCSRCSQRMDCCSTKAPPLLAIDGNGHRAACFLYGEMASPATAPV